MKKYLVTYAEILYFGGDEDNEPSQEETVTGYFRCYADDQQHAIEQCLDAYPDCEIIKVE